MNEETLRDLVGQVRDGALPRRDFIGRMVALGVGVPLASAMLADEAQAQGGASEAPYQPTKRGGGGPLRLLLWQGPTLLNPHFAAGTKDQEGCRPFYEPLARYDADGLLVPVLVTEIPSRANGGIASDGLSTTWKLKKNVAWHDGVPFTADDVVFNWQYATDPKTGAYSTGNYAGVRNVEKLDPYTVRFDFEKPTPGWSSACSVSLIPRHVFLAHIGATSREAPANQKPVGTGPYKFVEFTSGDLVRGELNAGYHMPNRPHFDTIEIKGGGDATSAARAVLQTGEFDYAWNVLVEDTVLKAMEAGGKGHMVFKPSGNAEMIALNASDPWTELDGERANVKSKHFAFSDPAVRKAFGLLVDRKSIQEFVYGRAAVATANALNNPVQYNSHAIVAEFNIDKANALLDAAGWKRGVDGVRQKDGRRLKLVYQTTINSVRQKVQAIVKQACAKAGIEVELKTVTASVYFSSDVTNPDTWGKFFADMEMYLVDRSGTDPSRLMQQWVSWEICQKANGWQGQNKTRWSSPEYDHVFRLSENELDPVKRAALFVHMNDLACNAGHVVPLAIRAQVTALGKSISAPLTGWDLDLSGIHDWFRA